MFYAILGCFWGVELAFQRVPGVVSTTVGYAQGAVPNPSYEAVCTGSTLHTEAVKISFSSDICPLEDLLTVFWDIHDPTTLNRQGNDIGTQYRSGIYYFNEFQKDVSFKSKLNEQKKYQDMIVTEILPSTCFYPAEDYHQKYLEKGGQCADKGNLSPIRCYG